MTIIEEMTEYVFRKGLHRKPDAVMQLTPQKLEEYHEHLRNNDLPEVNTFMGIPLQIPNPVQVNMFHQGRIVKAVKYPDGRTEIIG